MSIIECQQAPHVADQVTALDLVVKYAAVLTWLVYAAGLTRISGFLGTLSVPMDPDFYALPRVLSHGGFAVLEIVLGAAIGLFCMCSSDKKAPRVAEYAGWTLPVLFVILTKRILWEIGPLRLRLVCASCVLTAIYTLIVLVRKKRFASSREDQVVAALIFFVATTQGSGFTGDLEAHAAMAARPSVQVLLPPEAVPGASKLGLTFSISSAPGLSDPVNVVAFTDKMYYVWLPIELAAEGQSRDGIKLRLEQSKTVALPRDKVLIAAAAH